MFSYCHKIDGTLSWVTLFLIKTMHMSLEKEDNYEDLIPFQESIFFSKADSENRIQTSILALAIIANLIGNRADLM